jgi:Mn2+/Fe2+ NRAMP family transporter
MNASRSIGVFAVIGPGLLVAATGVGAGDLATASLAGSYLGPAILWAALLGAFLKYVVTEGIARYQLSTGDTLLEGVIRRFGPVAGWLFLPYFLFWSFFVASALMNASGVTLHALIPVFDNATIGKVVFGALASLAGFALVLRGGYALFDKVMRVSIGVMFVTVIVSAIALWPGTGEVARGLFVPRIPDFDGEGLGWTVALIGGIGGTFTILCYGYWIREEGRNDIEYLGPCRIDLGVGYLVTAIFGIAMVIIGSTIEVEGGGASLLVDLAARLEERLGTIGSLVFLVGAAGAVFSSLLGVWQAVPYLFADVWMLVREKPGEPNPDSVDTKAFPYRAYLAGLAIVPMVGLFWRFEQVQQVYAIIGATFIPLLALILLIVNRNRPATNVVLVGVLVFFSWLTFGG